MQRKNQVRNVFMGSTTYLANIAVVLQNAPDKMLTFAQLMAEVMPLLTEDRKSVENNIRVCLSSNKCFIKIPMVPGSKLGKKNYWKLDCSQITTKMVRRHFKGILHLFPELSPKAETENESREFKQDSPKAANYRAPVRYEAKFNSPFSIESLLKKDSQSPRGCRVSPLSSLQATAEQTSQAGTKRSFSWDPNESHLQTSDSSSFVCSPEDSTHHRLIIPGFVQLRKRVPEYSQFSFPFHTIAAVPSFTPSYVAYSVQDFPHDALRF